MNVPRTLLALLERDFANRRSYRFGFVMEIASVAVFLIAIFYVAKLVPAEVLGGRNYFSVTAVGLAVFSLLGAVGGAPRGFIVSELGRGTLETLLTLKPTLRTYLAAATLQSTLRSLARSVAILGAGAWFGGGMRASGWAWFLVLLPLGSVAMYGFGLLQAGLELQVRKAGRIASIFTGGSIVLTGVYFPVAMLPAPLHGLSDLLPVTHAISASRRILFEGAPGGRELGFLALLAAVLYGLGRWMLWRGERAMRRDGAFVVY